MTTPINSADHNPRLLEGTVVSNRMTKTIVVAVNRFTKHRQYGKYLQRTKRYKVHAPAGEYKIGDRVAIRETRPISKDKHFIVVAK